MNKIKEKAENPHIFHRQRLKERFIRDGVQSFDDKTLLELLLSFALPRMDTRPLAVDLLERFGTLANVMNATINELTKIDGIKQHTAVLITLIPELSRRFMLGASVCSLSLLDDKIAGEYLTRYFSEIKEERVLLLCLDAFGGLIEKKELQRGSINSAAFSMRLITETAINNSCGSVILAHNHPNGSVIPSNEDIYTTQRVAAALLINDIKLVEHYIVAGSKFTPIMKNMPDRYGSRTNDL